MMCNVAVSCYTQASRLLCYGNGYGSSLLPLPLKYSVINLLAHAVTIPQLHCETFGVRDLVPLEGRLEVGNTRVS